MTYKEQALTSLEQLRAALNAENLQDSLEYLQTLQTTLKDWRRVVIMRASKQALDEALQSDLLLFNAEEARQHLTQWAEVIGANTDLELSRYHTLVDDRVDQKQIALIVHGVVAHCESLFKQAAELESGQNPPRPEFLLTQYYAKAYAIARAACAEYADNAELEILFHRAERLNNTRQSAAKLYITALQDGQYADVLRDLLRLPPDLLIPRYHMDGVHLSFINLIPINEARHELQTLAQTWAQDRASSLITKAQRELDHADPQSALTTLGERTQIDEFLPTENRTQLDELVKRAQTDLAQRQQAEVIIAQATQTLQVNPIEAWSLYLEAQQLSSGAPDLPSLRETLVKALSDQLERVIERAGQAFDRREIELTRQICANARRLYGQKDTTIDALLDRLTELEEMTHRYEDYLRSAGEIYQQVRRLLSEDSAAANDLLTQLESYPDIILEAFPDLHEYRTRVNQRLNADRVYLQLYPLLFHADRATVERGIKATEEAAAEHSDDLRFPVLARHIHYHLDVLSAYQEHAAGRVAEAIRLLQGIPSDHPDYARSIALLNEWTRPS